MKDFTFKKGLVGNGLFVPSSFKSFMVMVVMIIMTTSSAMAQDAKFEVIDGFRYLLFTGTKTASLIASTKEKYSGDIVVPEKVKSSNGVEYNVTSLGDYCFTDCEELTSITIPSSITSLGDACFHLCSGLTSITIPSSVTSLGSSCFSGCSGLTSITIPSTVTSLKSSCFSGCNSLTSITIPSTVTSLGSGCFEYCSGLTSITIPSTVTSLGDKCFSGCSGLTSITIPSSVTSLDDECFFGCSGLTSITIPSTVTSLGTYCFSGCEGLTSITIPSSVTSLGNFCFSGCSGLTSVTIPSSVPSLGDACFEGCSSLTSVTIPSSVTSLGDACFSDCSSLTSITIPSSVTSLGNWCFNGCSALKTVCFKGKVPEMYSSETLPSTSVINVPAEYLQDYKDAFGTDYHYIYAWNPDESGDGDKPVTPCATPSVSYESGKLKFACETAGAKYHYTIADTDITSDALNENGEVSLSAAYNISVYATADGYTASENAEATLYWINANLETANINLAKTRGIVASAHDGIVSISGLDNGDVVKFYAADGKLLGSSSAVGGVASCAVSEKMVIAKIGMDTIKVLMK